MTTMNDAVRAQAEVRAAETRLRKARVRRDAAVVTALDEGHTIAVIARALDVTGALISKIAAAGGDMTTATPTQSRETSIRRALARRGHRLSKVRESHPDFRQYGPYMIVDAQTNSIVDHSLALDEVAAWIEAHDGTAAQ